MTLLGQKIRELREDMGLSRQKLTARSGLALSLLANLESGRRRYLTAGDIKRLASAFDVPEGELWKLIPEDQRDKWYIRITDRP